MHNKRISVCAAGMLLLAGCGEQRKLEDLGMIHAVALDRISRGTLQVGVSIPKPSEGGKLFSEYQTVQADSVKEARTKIQRRTGEILVSGQLRTILIGKDLAEGGIWRYMDAYQRDPIIGERTLIAVVDGPANNILSSDYPDRPSAGDYVNKLLLRDAKIHESPDVTVYSFARDFYDDGIDPIAPLLKLESRNVSISGIALFHGDSYAGSVAAQDIIRFLLLYGNARQGEIAMKLDGNEQVMISGLLSHRRTKVMHSKGGEPEVEIQLRIRASVLEYIGERDIGKEEDQEWIIQQITKHLEASMQDLVAQLQEKNADALGIGKRVRNAMGYDEWKAYDWNSRYPKLKIGVKIRLLIKDFGIKEG
ncbi:Ger(x)C family spore germination protein [Gorillibacterium sp. sgz5001074]|uniref:Ger(x)C family spore germination protein n=1 Tax=Gorillibacterium sp. sgz5001074 TaxID=3446695 RepID=UPI003F67B7D7